MEKKQWLEINIQTSSFKPHSAYICLQESNESDDNEINVSIKKKLLFSSYDIYEVREKTIETAQSKNERLIIKEFEI